MANILEQGQLAIMSQLLRVRLAHRALIDVNIISWDTLSKPVRIDNHHGRLLGCFMRRPLGAVCFLLFIRSQEQGKFDHVIAYYVNQRLFKIPESEIREFLHKVDGIPKMGVIRVVTKLIKSCYPSALIHGIEVTIGLHLVNNFKKLQIVELNTIVSFLSTRPSSSLPLCNIANPTSTFQKLWTDLKMSNLVCVDFNCHGTLNIPNNFDILRVKFKGHFYYGVHYKNESLLMLLVCHDALLRTQQDKDQLIASLSKGFGNDRPNYIYASRFKSEDSITCCDKLILDACAKLRAFPLLLINDIDVKALVRCENLNMLPRFGFDEPNLPREDPIDISEDPLIEIGSSQRSISTVCNNDGYTASITSDTTQIYSVGELQSQIVGIRQELSQVSPLISQLNEPEPLRDNEDNLLHDVSFFLKFLERIIPRLQSHVSVNVSQAVDFEGLEAMSVGSTEQRGFLIIPLITIDVSVLIVVHHDDREWGYINGTQLSYLDTFNCVKASFKGFGNYRAKIIELTSSFHREYSLVHLMMAITCLDRAFHYALALPEILIYQEKEFRTLCYSLCLQQQVVNQTYNLRHGLVQESGVLASGAFVSYSSPIQYEQSVVKTDQCLFCKKRYSKNLGVHMKMAHGGLAQYNRELRRQKDLASTAGS